MSAPASASRGPRGLEPRASEPRASEPRGFERDALEHEAPFLIDKLVEDRIASDAAEAEALFRELKRFLVLIRTNDHLQWEMCSHRVDETWHQFMLFSREYIQFCMRYFGGYVQHRPGRASATLPRPPALPSFRARYEAYYGEPLPDVWYDDKSVTPRRRVINDAAGRMRVRIEGELVSLESDAGDVHVSAGPLALAALRFIARTDAFYVRELPGKLTSDEQVVLVATLVERQVLRVAP